MFINNLTLGHTIIPNYYIASVRKNNYMLPPDGQAITATRVKGVTMLSIIHRSTLTDTMGLEMRVTAGG